MEPSLLSDIQNDQKYEVRDYQENQDEDNYKNGWYFLYYVKITVFL